MADGSTDVSKDMNWTERSWAKAAVTTMEERNFLAEEKLSLKVL
jgi:hypothetical protein